MQVAKVHMSSDFIRSEEEEGNLIFIKWPIQYRAVFEVLSFLAFEGCQLGAG